MDAPRAYLDHNATAPIRPEVVEAVAAALRAGGNPSSVHAEGRAARARVEAAREAVAALVGARPREVVFTSGGTEANAMALTPALVPVADRRPLDRLLVAAAEHACVLSGGSFPRDRIETIPVTPGGVADMGWLEGRLARAKEEGERVMVALQAANNETGVLQPVRQAAGLVHDAGGVLHCDAVQAAGKVEIDMAGLGADTLALSAHKIGGPPGAGALVVSPRVHLAEPLLRGGGQERGSRAGTENVPGIAGFGAAARAALDALAGEHERLASLRDRLEAGLLALAPEAVVFGRSEARLPNTTLIALPGWRAETALIALDLAGIAASSGSACSSGKVKPSHVLAAMGVEPDLAACAIRLSIGWTSTDAEVNRALEAFENARNALYRRRGRQAA
jgi:cysteine desulfurase